MAEIVGLTGSIIAIATAAAAIVKVSTALRTIANDFSEARDDILSLALDIDVFAGVMKYSTAALKDHTTRYAASPLVKFLEYRQLVENLDAQVARTNVSIEKAWEASRMIQSKIKIITKVKWLLRKNIVKELHPKMESVKMSLHIMVTAAKIEALTMERGSMSAERYESEIAQLKLQIKIYSEHIELLQDIASKREPREERSHPGEAIDHSEKFDVINLQQDLTRLSKSLIQSNSVPPVRRKREEKSHPGEVVDDSEKFEVTNLQQDLAPLSKSLIQNNSVPRVSRRRENKSVHTTLNKERNKSIHKTPREEENEFVLPIIKEEDEEPDSQQQDGEVDSSWPHVEHGSADEPESTPGKALELTPIGFYPMTRYFGTLYRDLTDSPKFLSELPSSPEAMIAGSHFDMEKNLPFIIPRKFTHFNLPREWIGSRDSLLLPKEAVLLVRWYLLYNGEEAMGGIAQEAGSAGFTYRVTLQLSPVGAKKATEFAEFHGDVRVGTFPAFRSSFTWH